MSTSSNFADLFGTIVQSPAFWAMAGAVGVKVLDMLIAKRKTHSEVVTSAYSAVNEAQRQLVDGLFQQVGLLNDEIEKLKKQVVERDLALAEAKAAIDMLTLEVAVLKGRNQNAP
jgi:hypothetical protein